MRMESDEEENDHTINWYESLYLREPYLITEDDYNKYNKPMTYKEYCDALSEKMCRQSTANPRDEINKNQKKISDIKKEEESTSFHMLEPHPKPSAVSNNDRSFYRWYMQEKKQGKPIPKGKTWRFEALIKRVRFEQQEYQQFLLVTSQKITTQYMYIQPTHLKQIHAAMKKQVRERSDMSKKLGKLESCIAVKNLLGKSKLKNISLKFEKTVKEQMAMREIVWPPLFQKMSTDDLFQKCTTYRTSSSFEYIGDDANFPPYDVFIHSQTVLDIVRGFMSTGEFLIPVNIKCHQGNCDKKVIYFKENLPQRSTSTRRANFNFYRPVVIGNVTTGCTDFSDRFSTVNMFSLGELKLLVRASKDAVDRTTNDLYQIYPKVEFQLAVGFEQYSISELCEFWWDSYLSNANLLACVRVDPRNENIVRVDRYVRDKMYGPSCPYNPKTNATQLHALIIYLLNREPGDYFIEKRNGDDSLNVYASSEDGMSLRDKYVTVLTADALKLYDTADVWLPIDMTILPLGWPELDIPWLFYPIDIPNKKNSKKKRGIKHNVSVNKKRAAASNEFSSQQRSKVPNKIYFNDNIEPELDYF